MTGRLSDDQIAAAVGRVEEALAAVEGLPPLASAALTEAVSSLVDLYGEGLWRIVEQAATDAPGLVDALVGDPLLSHLLLVHDLHPTMGAEDLELLEASLVPGQSPGSSAPTTTFIPIDAVGVRTTT